MAHQTPGGVGVRRTPAFALIALLTLAFLAFTAPAGSAARGPARERTSFRTETLDVRRSGSPVAPSARVAAARAELGRSLGRMGVIQSDRTTGTIRFVGRLDGFLTDASTRPASSVALDYVRQHHLAMGLRTADLQTFHLRDDYVDIGGTHHLSFVQRAGGLTLFGQGLRANVTADGRLINVAGGPVRGLHAPSGDARLDAGAAIAAARTAAGGTAARDRQDTAELALFPTGRGARLAWKTLTNISPSETNLSLVDASTGAVLYRNNITDAGAPPQTAATGDDVWPFYFSSIPPNGGGTPVDDVALGTIFDTNPLTFGGDGPQLFGNNAWVFRDVMDDSFPHARDAITPTGGSAGTGWRFDYTAPIDVTTASQNCSAERACTWDREVARSWQANLDHNGVQVYYFLNHFHDHLAAAPIGFTDAAGNFEFSGTGGPDPVLGNASDGANTADGFPDLGHVDNANMSTPPDGNPPTMQMYLFEKFRRFGLGGIPSANGGDDAEVVYHEYTHGLSNRLVLYPDGNSGLDAQQSGAMGEAWSDWYAEDLLNKEGYKPDSGTVGDVVMGELTFAGLLRSQPVDCPVGTTSPNCPGTPGAGPGGYTYGDFGAVDEGPEVHADGEIWLETLWDIRQALPDQLVRGLVTRGMELSPPSPSFLDMRNAIIQADIVNNGGANVDDLWQLFANRGMGYFASTLSGGDVTPVEDFSLPPVCGPDPCSTITGTVTDRLTGEPLQGANVGIGGLNTAVETGFDMGLSDRTGADGTYVIRDVPDHDAYPALIFADTGYEPFAKRHVVVDGSTTVDGTLIRDWASLSGGATLVSASPPDYTDFCGTGANGAFDLNLGSGWPSDAVGSTAGSDYTGRRKATVRLPQRVDITAVAVASGGTCGDDATAGVKHFQVLTRTGRDAPWKLAVDAKTDSDGVLRPFEPVGGARNVRTIRFVMISNHGDPFFMDVLEVSVRGRAVDGGPV